MGWAPHLHTRFHVSRTTLDPASLISLLYRTFTFFGSPSQTILLQLISGFCSPKPSICKQTEFGLFLFRSPLLQESSFLSLPIGTKMFQFPTFPSIHYFTHVQITDLFLSVEFPHSEIHGYNEYLLFPVAFRSLSRPSSALGAQVSSLRSLQLNRKRLKNFVLLR